MAFKKGQWVNLFLVTLVALRATGHNQQVKLSIAIFLPVIQLVKLQKPCQKGSYL